MLWYDWISFIKGDKDLSVGVLPTASIPRWTQNPFDNQLFLTTGTHSGYHAELYEPAKKENFLIVDFNQDTIGRVEAYDFLPILLTHDITKAARETLKLFENNDLVAIAEKLLIAFHNQLAKTDYDNFLPPIRAFKREDKSVLLEWIFDKFRIGFSFELQEDDASWYLVSDDSIGNIIANGNLLEQNFNFLTKWLLTFVEDNVTITA